MSDARTANIGPGGQRRRLTMGAGSIGFGVAVMVALILTGAPRGWILAAFLPFWVGALGLIQARERT